MYVAPHDIVAVVRSHVTVELLEMFSRSQPLFSSGLRQNNLDFGFELTWCVQFISTLPVCGR
jgi:hypothetical protein